MRCIIFISLLFYSAIIHAQSGDVKLKLSLPYVNHVSTVVDGEGRQSELGFLGSIIGLKYHISPRHALILDYGLVATSLFPVPAPYRISGYFTNLYSTQISLSHNYSIHPKISLGYGLNWSKMNWSAYYIPHGIQDSTAEFRIDKHHSGMGLNLNGYYHFGQVFSTGMRYQNQILRLNQLPTISYSHTISIDLIWHLKLNLFKPKSEKKS